MTKFDPSMLSGYLDDELTPEEREVVEQRLSTSASDRQLLEDLTRLRNQLAALPQESFTTDPVAAVRHRIERQRVTNTEAGEVDRPPAHALRWWIPLALAAGVLALALWIPREDAPELATGNVRSPAAGEGAPPEPDLRDPHAFDAMTAERAAVEPEADGAAGDMFPLNEPALDGAAANGGAGAGEATRMYAAEPAPQENAARTDGASDFLELRQDEPESAPSFAEPFSRGATVGGLGGVSRALGESIEQQPPAPAPAPAPSRARLAVEADAVEAEAVETEAQSRFNLAPGTQLFRMSLEAGERPELVPLESEQETPLVGDVLVLDIPADSVTSTLSWFAAHARPETASVADAPESEFQFYADPDISLQRRGLAGGDAERGPSAPAVAVRLEGPASSVTRLVESLRRRASAAGDTVEQELDERSDSDLVEVTVGLWLVLRPQPAAAGSLEASQPDASARE